MEDVKKHYFPKEELEKQLSLLDKYEPISEEYKTQALKIIASYCKPLILTKKGIDRGLELMSQWKEGKNLTRTELFDLYILGPEAKMITGGNGTYEDMAEIYQQLYDRYKPEGEYLKSYIYEVLFPEGYMKGNPNFADNLSQTVENYTNGRPGLRAIFFTVDIHIMRD